MIEHPPLEATTCRDSNLSFGKNETTQARRSWKILPGDHPKREVDWPRVRSKGNFLLY